MYAIEKFSKSNATFCLIAYLCSLITFITFGQYMAVTNASSNAKIVQILQCNAFYYSLHIVPYINHYVSEFGEYTIVFGFYCRTIDVSTN